MKYAKERHAFGKPIGAFQGLQFKIADMEARSADVARLAYHDAAGPQLQGGPSRPRPRSPSSIATETAVTNAREAVQVHGGYGFIEEFPVARFYRDAKVLEIGEGTSEVQRILIARDLGL